MYSMMNIVILPTANRFSVYTCKANLFIIGLSAKLCRVLVADLGLVAEVVDMDLHQHPHLSRQEHVRIWIWSCTLLCADSGSVAIIILICSSVVFPHDQALLHLDINEILSLVPHVFILFLLFSSNKSCDFFLY